MDIPENYDDDAFFPPWVRKAFEAYYAALVEKDYQRAEDLDSGNFYDAALIAEAIGDYGCVLRPFPPLVLDVAEGFWIDPNSFHVLINCYTDEEEGESDLAIAMIIFRKEDGEVAIDVRGIYVP